jgi:signal transduction histidine kinase
MRLPLRLPRVAVYGVGARLSLALAVVVGGALAIVYLVVVPSLENRVVDQKLAQLRSAAGGASHSLPANPFLWPDFVELVAAQTNTRVVIYEVLNRQPVTLIVMQDSHGVSSADVAEDATAARAAERREAASGAVTRGGDRYAEVAVPFETGTPILLLSAPLGDSLAEVRLVERRLLLAGAIALGVAVVFGYAASILFARRLRRLERAADRISRGDFGQPVVDRGRDEVGELAATFDRMREQLAQLDNARREFIANASHELRTPLFSLGGFLELLDDEDVDERTRAEFVATAREQVERLTRLATDLLDLSRLDAGRLHVEHEQVDVAAAARAAAGEFLAVARSQGRTLEVQADEPVLALADEERVLRILRALVENALVHTPPDAVVRVGAAARGARAEIDVEDDGPGIAPEHVPQVFERFYRVEGDVASGSGLGLAIAKELACLMGGELRLDSHPGRTIFTLSLPAVLAPVAEAVVVSRA